MIKFEKIRYKNIMSTGNHPIEIKFDEAQTTLITGTNGAGKCVRGNTSIKVVFASDEDKAVFGDSFVDLTIYDVVQLFVEQPEIGERGIFVTTRFGLKRIEYADVTKRNSEWISIRLENGKSIECAIDHLLFEENKEWQCAGDLSIGKHILTSKGYSRIKSIQLSFSKEDLYDLQVEDVKEYYANGIVSHNSTMIESLIFGLYGKPFRKINKGQLLNSVNKKNLLVEIWFTKGSDSYKIIRGIKPNIFEIYKNDTLIDQSAAVRDYQSEFEENILKMNFKAFTQIVVLGMATFVPFMELPAAQRREFIEELLDYSIFSKMNVLFKEDLSENKTALKDIDKDIDSTKTLVKTIQKHNEEILKLKNQNNDMLYEEIEKLLSKTDELKAEVDEKTAEIEILESKIADEKSVLNKIEKRKEIIRDLNKDIAEHSRNIDFYGSNSSCPTCEQNIPEKLREEKIELDTSDKAAKLNAISELNDMISKLNARKDEIDNDKSSIRRLETEVQIAKSSINNSISIMMSNKKKMENTSSEEIKSDELNNANDRLKSLHDEYDKHVKNKEIYAIISSILKDSGLKSHMVKKYIDVINTSINKYLNAFGLYVDFHLDENFNEVIKARYRDEFSFSSFSEGEKMRINFAILFAWRELSQLRNSMTTNLLILDEVLDGVVDSDGIGSIIESLKNINQKDNIFVITHRGNQIGDSFEKNLHFEKDGNFTILKED